MGGREMTNKKQRNRKGLLTPEQVEWAYSRWCAGYSLQDIADVLFISPSAIYKAFNGRRRKRPPLEPPKS